MLIELIVVEAGLAKGVAMVASYQMKGVLCWLEWKRCRGVLLKIGGSRVLKGEIKKCDLRGERAREGEQTKKWREIAKIIGMG